MKGISLIVRRIVPMIVRAADDDDSPRLGQRLDLTQIDFRIIDVLEGLKADDEVVRPVRKNLRGVFCAACLEANTWAFEVLCGRFDGVLGDVDAVNARSAPFL